MSYLVIARKWRPQTFDEVVGQEHVTTTLKNSIQIGRIGHAYLFTGIRGVGKTTAARILAKALNCIRGPTPEPCNECPSCVEITQGISLDVREIDGASNRGIDNVRDLREGAAFAPARDRFKVYIIDEVHMLTQEAFNALLKTLEEPPAHVVFILATTEVHKVPATIASRCQVFEFRRIPIHLLVERLALIAQKEGFQVSEDALRMIAREAEGSLRDASSFLDQVASFADGRVDVEQVREVLRTGNWAAAREVLSAILTDDPAIAVKVFLRASAHGVPPRQFLKETSKVLADAIQVRLLGDDAARETGLTRGEVSDLLAMTSSVSMEYLAALLHLLVTAVDQAAESRVPDLVALAVLIRAAEMRSLAEVKDLITRIEALATGRTQPDTAPPPPGPGTVNRVLTGRGVSTTSRPHDSASQAAPACPSVERPRNPSARSYSRTPTRNISRPDTPDVSTRPTPSKPQPASPTLETENRILSRFLKHPVVDRVLEIFGGDVIDVREDS